MTSDPNAIYSLLEYFNRDDRSDIEDFHQSTKLIAGGNKAFVRRTGMFLNALPVRHLVVRAWKDFSGRDTVGLPAPSLPDRSLEDVLRARRSLSNVAAGFGSGSMRLEQLAAILGWSYGITGEIRGARPQDPVQPLRAAASAGALYPLELYVVAHNVELLPGTLYHYGVRDHNLEVLRGGSCWDEFMGAMTSQSVCSSAAAVLVITAVLERSVTKYFQRGYRMAMNDAGAALQNLYLTTCASGLTGCALGGFYDDALGNFLGIDNVNEVPVLCFAIGAPPGEL